ncbi:MAG: DUF882 domain-containing protein [Pseudomonadota bacterium]
MDESKDRGRRVSAAGMRRRDFLRLGALGGAVLLGPAAHAGTRALPERRLSFHNTHTGENLAATYWAEGGYVDSELQDINTHLRDHRSGEIHTIDTDLLDLLYVLRATVGSHKPFQVISGYRSPATNAALRSASSGVAKRSFHMQGKAIDIRLPGCDLKRLHTAALALQAGGVGYYPGSDFIHVDVGPQRSW